MVGGGNNAKRLRAYSSSEFVVANTFSQMGKVGANEINFSQGFSQKVYSEKQLKDIKILLTLSHLGIEFSNKLFLSLIELSLCNSPKCKLKFTGHWLRYSTTPNVPTLSTQSSQAKNLALSIFVETFTRSLLMF